MKKLYLLPILFFLMMASCKKEDAPTPHDDSTQLKGTWASSTKDIKYYDASGQLIYEETDEEKTLLNFEEPNVTTTYSTGTESKCLYTFFESNGKSYLQFYYNGRLQEFEITSMTHSAMSWQTRSGQSTFRVSSTTRQADHVIVTFNLSKQ